MYGRLRKTSYSDYEPYGRNLFMTNIFYSKSSFIYNNIFENLYTLLWTYFKPQDVIQIKMYKQIEALNKIISDE